MVNTSQYGSKTRRTTPLCSLAIGLASVLTLPTAGCQDAEGRLEGFDNRADEDGERSVIRVRTKSYIAALSAADLVPMVGSRPALYAALVAATNLAYSEDPPDPTQQSAQFRSWVDFTVGARCVHGEMIEFDMLSTPQFDVGKEGPFDGVMAPIPLEMTTQPIMGATGETLGYEVDFIAAAQPNPLVEPTLQAVKFRSRSAIWTQGNLRVVCDDDEVLTEASVEGSAFPSHKLWLEHDGVERIYERPQGSYHNLWELPARPRLGVIDVARSVVGDTMTEQLLQPGGLFVWERDCDASTGLQQLVHCSDWAALPPDGHGPLSSIGMFPLPGNGSQGPTIKRSLVSDDGTRAWGYTCDATADDLHASAPGCHYDLEVDFRDHPIVVNGEPLSAVGGYDAFVNTDGQGGNILSQSLFNREGDFAYGRRCRVEDGTTVDWANCANDLDEPTAPWFAVPFSPPLAGYGTSMFTRTLPTGTTEHVFQTIIYKDQNPDGSYARGSSLAYSRECPIRDGKTLWGECDPAWREEVIGGTMPFGDGL